MPGSERTKKKITTLPTMCIQMQTILHKVVGSAKFLSESEGRCENFMEKKSGNTKHKKVPCFKPQAIVDWEKTQGDTYLSFVFLQIRESKTRNG